MTLKIILIFFGTILAFWLSAICGGGASLILIPILNLLLPTSLVPFTLTIGTFTSSVSRVSVFRSSINWRICFVFVPFSIPAVFFGAWLLKYVNPLYLQIFVGLFLIANLPELFISRDKFSRNKTYSKWVLPVVGFLAGFVSGITGAVGLLFNRFYLNMGLNKEEIVATRAANELLLHFIKLLIYLALNLYSSKAIYLGLAIAIAAVISSITVTKILSYISEFLFRKIGYAAMVMSGLVLLVSTVQAVIHQDNIHMSVLAADSQYEASVHWRKSDFVLEYAFDDVLEIEKRIPEDELPSVLQAKFTEMRLDCDEVQLEKVYKFRKLPSFEFYCYKNSMIERFEFEGPDYRLVQSDDLKPGLIPVH